MQKVKRKCLGQSVPAVDAEIRTGDVLGRVGEEEGHGAHQVFGCTHLADGDEGDPLIAELGVLVEDLAGPECIALAHISQSQIQHHDQTYSAVNM